MVAVGGVVVVIIVVSVIAIERKSFSFVESLFIFISFEMENIWRAVAIGARQSTIKRSFSAHFSSKIEKNGASEHLYENPLIHGN